ncbi:tRNA (guanine(26)-N(2))-dimethyltransferase [Candidatus Woesearchaeota archaeon]|nr:tRNA (guanine(26)-N(2))-dimethyltransferase [Candidatus Woesearchaeota archaeon]
MFKEVTEAGIVFDAPEEEKISAKLPVFYNPVMKLNRDISVLLLKAIETPESGLQVCDLLAGSGVRSIRFLAELEKKIKSITINDYSEQAAEIIRKNLEMNKDKTGKANPDAEINITNSEASTLLLQSTGFDYIDIDPFGTPNPFLDAAIRRLAREGILAVTATDTSALAGTFPKVCMRKYWAVPDRGPMKHELGLRILIRKCQLVASQYEKALIPIYSYSKEHYMRVFFRCKKGKAEVDKVVKQHGMFNEAGPLWLGSLWDAKLAEKMYLLVEELGYETEGKFLRTIKDESKIDVVGFHDIHALCKKNSIEVPAFAPVFEGIITEGYSLSRTHFSDFGVRSTICEEDLLEIVQSVANRK